MTYNNKLLLFLIILATAQPIYAQVCQNVLPDSVKWTGTSDGMTMWNPGNLSALQISKTGEGKYVVGDLTAGFFQANGIPYQIEIEIDIGCDATVSPKDFESDFGVGSVKSGQWDAVGRRLTIQWEIPGNNLNETSTFSCP